MEEFMGSILDSARTDMDNRWLSDALSLPEWHSKPRHQRTRHSEPLLQGCAQARRKNLSSGEVTNRDKTFLYQTSIKPCLEIYAVSHGEKPIQYGFMENENLCVILTTDAT